MILNHIVIDFKHIILNNGCIIDLQFSSPMDLSGLAGDAASPHAGELMAAPARRVGLARPLPTLSHCDRGMGIQDWAGWNMQVG
jgi:hypothetical protein